MKHIFTALANYLQENLSFSLPSLIRHFSSSIRLLFYFLLLSSPSSAQFTENFNDGDLTNNPAWTGNLTSWTDTLSRLRSNDTVASNKYYISTPSTLAANAQWEWWDSLQFNPSSANYIDVYLTSDNNDLEATSFNGYFVRIGNTSDEISLYRRSGSTVTEIIDGLDGVLNSSNNVMRIKITRDAANAWTLMRDSTGSGNNFVTEGTVTDATFTTSSFFGIVVQQSTSSFFKKHWFDDIYVGPVTGDTTAPTLLQVTVLSSTQLDLKFSEPLNQTPAENETNYWVNNGIGNPSSALRDNSDFSLVHLSFSTPFSNGINYLITVSAILDITGNTMPATNKAFTYLVAVPAVFKDVVINEIFADPSPQIGLPNAEFVELHNRSAKTLDLNGWKFSDGSSTAVLGSYVLLPDSFLIVCPSANVAEFSAFGATLGVSSFPSLNNTGDNLTLTDAGTTLVDAVNFSDAWYQDAVKKNGGWTLELINPGNLCNGGTNWIASSNASGGTPGKINSVYSNTPDTQAPSLVSVNVVSLSQIELVFSEGMDSASLAGGTYSLSNGLSAVSVAVAAGNVSITLTLSSSLDSSTIYTVTAGNVEDCSGNSIGGSNTLQFSVGYQPAPGEIIINEIFADPSPQIGLPDAEYVELFNTTNKSFSLNNCFFSGISFPSGITIPANGYLILTASSTAGLLSAYGTVVSMPGWSSTFLTNSGKDLMLVRGTETLDRVIYELGWYKDMAKDDGGWSLERVNPTLPCSSADNWKASADPSGGTPGKINSVYSAAPDAQPPIIASVMISSPVQIILNFSEGMDSASLMTSYAIDNGISVITVQPLAPELTGVLLTLSAPLDPGKLYTGNVSGVKDCSGNSSSVLTFSFGIGVLPAKNEVLINEIYPDPDAAVSPLPETEFVEIYNKTSKVIDLTACKFSDESSSAVFANTVIFPDSYLILCASSGQEQYAQYGRAIGLTGFPSMNNAAEKLTLKDSSGAILHEVTYSDNWYGDETKKAGGWTLELIDPANPCGEETNWSASADPSGGTPGKINSVKGSNPDNSAPQIASVFALDPLSVELYFNEPVDSLSAKNATYAINNGIGIFAVLVIDSKIIQVNLANALQPKITYTITVSGINDCLGNSSSNASADFSLSEQAVAGNIIINEVLFNPRTNGADFVELYNHSDKVINIQDWALAKIAGDTISSIKIISAIPLIIEPHSYLALTADTDNIKKEYPLGKPENYRQMPSFPSYNDDSSTVILLTDEDIVSDAFSYTEKMHFALLKDENGVSLERIDFSRPAGDATNWHSAAEAVGWATPGYRNSQYFAGEGDGSAISVDPEVFSPDNDGMNDVVNIHYKFNAPGYVANVTIFDAKGRLIRSLAKNSLLGMEGVFSWDGISDKGEKARIGIYVILVEAFDLTGKKQHFKKTCVVAGKLE